MIGKTWGLTSFSPRDLVRSALVSTAKKAVCPRLKTLSLLTLLCTAVACTQAPAPDNREADSKAIKDVEANWAKAASSKNADSFIAFYADDASLLMPNAPVFTGKPAIKDALKPIMDDPNFTLTFNPNKVEVAKSGELAYTQGPYKMTFSDLQGHKFEDEGKYLTVWRKLPDGTWKAIEDTFMTDLPLPPPPN